MKIITPNRNYLSALVTLLFVIFLEAVYLFIYLPNNGKRIEAQRFKTLQNIDRNIHEKLKNGADLMANLLESYHRELLHERPADETYVQKYIRSLPKSEFILGSPQRPVIVPKDTILADAYKIRIDRAKQEIHIEVQKVFGDTLYRMSMSYSIFQFIKPLLPENIFDQYVIFSNGQVAYETFPSGISYNEDSLLGKRNGIAAVTLRDLTVGGVNYKAFLQPVVLATESAWVVGGLLEDARY